MMRFWRCFLYRPVNRLLHRFNLHYMEPSYPEGPGILYWCHWCGLRDTKPRDMYAAIRAADKPPAEGDED